MIVLQNKIYSHVFESNRKVFESRANINKAF